jgi:SnoaL-like domain
VTAIDRVRIARETYGAYEFSDPAALEKHLSSEFRFYSPADVGIDLPTYWQRCWPNADRIAGFEFKRIIEHGDDVVVTYEATKTDGTRFRNTEILTFEGERIAVAEVYFGWNVD